MSDVHQWDIEIIGTVIGTIDYDVYTEFFTGPFDPKASVIVCKIRAWNTGTMSGQVLADLYEYPGEPNEAPITGVGWILDPKAYGGVAGEHAFEVVIPDDPGGKWPLGIKVFGETEVEPTWGLAGALLLPPLAVHR